MLNPLLRPSAQWVVLFGLLTSISLAQKPTDAHRVISDIQYANPDGHALNLDLYLPEPSDQPAPTVIFVHGGGWKNGSKASGAKTAAWLTDHGFAVASINYRLTNVAGWPAQINDCYESVRWVRTHAKQYHLDPDRIGCWGTSAGAHLAAIMGTRRYPGPETVSSQVQAVCDWFGPSELLTMPPNNIGNGRTAEDVAQSNGAKLLRATVREVPELAKDASGIDHVTSDDPPFLIMHGDKDPGVPVQQSLRLHRRLVDAGVASQLVIVKGAGHGGKAFRADDVKRTVRQFFTRSLKSVWPQGSGPIGNFSGPGKQVPTHWSVVRDDNIRWRTQLPETGQSTVTVWENRAYFTTLQEVPSNAALGQNIVAYCCDALTGEVRWKHELPGEFPLRLSGCFGDSSSPPAVTNGDKVVFFNASGSIACFTNTGQPVWKRESMAVARSQPFLVGSRIVYTRQSYMPDAEGHFTHEHKDAPKEMWTQLCAIDIDTGEPAWTSVCGVNMGSVPLPVQLADGRTVIVVGRGGGHSPPERPEGISLISAEDGSTVWTLPLDGFMSTMSHNIHDNRVLVFHDDQHLWVDVDTAVVQRSVSFLEQVSVRRRIGDQWKSQLEQLPPPKKKRAIIQQSNILIGDYHYFRSYSRPYLGRIHASSGRVEYLQLPVQLKRTTTDDKDALLWGPEQLSEQAKNTLINSQRSKRKPKQLPINLWAFEPNHMKNSRGHVVMGDARSAGTGWGHHASQLPTAVGNHLFIPIMNGTVYVIDAAAETLDENAIVAINDLGAVGQSFNRASLSYAAGRLYAHTIGEVICIESPQR